MRPEIIDISEMLLCSRVRNFPQNWNQTDLKYTRTIYSTRSLHFCNNWKVSKWFQKSFSETKVEDFGIFSLGDVEHPNSVTTNLSEHPRGCRGAERAWGIFCQNLSYLVISCHGAGIDYKHFLTILAPPERQRASADRASKGQRRPSVKEIIIPCCQLTTNISKIRTPYASVRTF